MTVREAAKILGIDLAYATEEELKRIYDLQMARFRDSDQEVDNREVARFLEAYDVLAPLFAGRTREVPVFKRDEKEDFEIKTPIRSSDDVPINKGDLDLNGIPEPEPIDERDLKLDSLPPQEIEEIDENDLKITGFDEDEKEMSEEELAARLANIKQRFIDIFELERKEALEEGPFNDADLEKFKNKYQKLKEEANRELISLEQEQQARRERMEEAKKAVALAGPTIEDRPIGLPGPTLADNQMALSGPTLEDNQVALAGPTIEERQIGLPGPTLDDSQVKLAGPTIEERKIGLPGPTLADSQVKLVGPTFEERQIGLSGPTIRNETRKKEERGLLTIIQELTKDLDLKKKDHKRLRASNINITNTLKQDLATGNYLYNIVSIVPTLIVKVPLLLITKLKEKIFKDKNAIERSKELKRRIDQLSDQDLQTIYEEYRGGRVLQEAFPTVLNDLLKNRISTYVMGKVEQLNHDVKDGYLEIYSSFRELQEVDRILEDEDLLPKEIEIYKEYKRELLEGKSELVEQIRAKQKEANLWLSGGLHGFSEDMKARESKLSYVGKRFAKSHDLDLALLERQAKLEQEEKMAVDAHQDAKALVAFIKNETLLVENTAIENSVFGKRSTGKKYYSPLAEMLDYRQDPFVKNLFVTMAMTGALTSAIHGAYTHRIESQKVLENVQQKDKLEEVHRLGEELAGQKETFSKGMKAQSAQAMNSTSGTIEVTALDKNNWHFDSMYRQDDALGHAFTSEMFHNTDKAFTDVANQYASGAISQSQSFAALKDIANEVQDMASKVYSSCLSYMKEYAKEHPQFDLSSALGTIDIYMKNPTAIINMNNAMLRSSQIGDELVNLTVGEEAILEALPSDLATTLASTVTTVAFAQNVVHTMESYQKNAYGNEVTKMVSDYAKEVSQDENSENIAKAA